MPAPFNSTIGTGGTYSTFAAWLADMPADITTGGGAGSYTASFKNQTFSSFAETLSGITTDSSHTITLNCDTGASFRDNASVQTNALRCNGSNGALLTGSNAYGVTLLISVSNVTLSGLQVENTSVVGSAAAVTGSPAAVTYDGCIFHATPGQTGRAALHVAGGSSVVKNCLVEVNGAIGVGIGLASAGSVVSDSTVARTADQTAAGIGINSIYSGPVLKGNAIFNFATPIGGSAPGSTSDYNATDQSSLGTSIPGTHNLLSQTYSSCFINAGGTPANADFRIGSGSPLKDVGVVISGVSADIAGSTRPQGATPDIGAWEYFTASTATAYTLTAAPNPDTVSNAVTATVTPTGGVYTGTITVTPSGTASTGLSAHTFTFSASSTAQTFNWTPTVTGTLTLTGTNSGSLTNPSVVNVTVNTAPLAVTAISCTPTRTTLPGSVTASGGTVPYTYQWSYASTPGGTYANFGTSSNSQTLSGLPYKKPFWLKCVVTDNVSSTVTAGPTPFATRPPWSIGLGFGGDSITGSYITPSFVSGYIEGATPQSDIVIGSIPSVNAGISGSASGDWLPTAANWPSAPISGGSNIYTWATGQLASSLTGVTTKVVHLMLGTNDAFASVTPAAYGNNMRAICGALVALGYRVLLSYPPYRSDSIGPGNAAMNDLILKYHARIDALIDNVGVFQGDQDAYCVFADDPSNLLDGTGIHPQIAGGFVLEYLWAQAIIRQLEREGHDPAPPHKVRFRLGAP